MSINLEPTITPTVHFMQVSATGHVNTNIIQCEVCPIHPNIIISKPRWYFKDVVKLIHVICPSCAKESMDVKNWDQVTNDMKIMNDHYVKLQEICTYNINEFQLLSSGVASILIKIQEKGSLQPDDVDDYNDMVHFVSKRFERDISDHIVKAAAEDDDSKMQQTTETLQQLQCEMIERVNKQKKILLNNFLQ
jgi:hypothetical protein